MRWGFCYLRIVVLDYASFGFFGSLEFGAFRLQIHFEKPRRALADMQLLVRPDCAATPCEEDMQQFIDPRLRCVGELVVCI